MVNEKPREVTPAEFDHSIEDCADKVLADLESNPEHSGNLEHSDEFITAVILKLKEKLERKFHDNIVKSQESQEKYNHLLKSLNSGDKPF